MYLVEIHNKIANYSQSCRTSSISTILLFYCQLRDSEQFSPVRVTDYSLFVSEILKKNLSVSLHLQISTYSGASNFDLLFVIRIALNIVLMIAMG